MNILLEFVNGREDLRVDGLVHGLVHIGEQFFKEVDEDEIDGFNV